MKKAMFFLSVLGLFICFPAADQQANSGPQAKVVRPESYAAAALESVKKQLSVDGLNLEIVGEPVLKPDVSGLIADAPDAIVLMNLNSGATVKAQALITFADNRPVSTQFSPDKYPFSVGTLDRAELRQIANELESFFEVAVDVSRGSERFYPYLQDDIRSFLKYRDRKLRMYIPPGAVDPSWREKLAQDSVSRSAKPAPLEGLDGWNEKLSDEELRHLVALQLDAIVQQAFLAIGGYEKGFTALGNRLRPQALVSNPREFIKLLEESIAQNRSLLQKAEFLSPDHLKVASRYMRRVIGQGFIVKEVSKPDPCPCFMSSPADAALYVTSFGSLSGGLALHFTRLGGSLRIVCAAIP
jgi:hypothetical protein